MGITEDGIIMKRYIGVKDILGREMNRKEYNDYRGWEVPSDENPNDEGYLVEYLNSPNSNHPNHKNYISWSPRDVFEEAYRRTNGMPFGLALEALKQGYKVYRTGWNGKGMWLGYVRESNTINFIDPYSNNLKNYRNYPYVVMKTVEDKIVPWLASQTDMLSDDWCILD